MIQRIQERIKRSAIWKWGGEESKNGWNAVAYLILFSFAFYAQVRTYDISKDSSRTARATADQALEISRIQSDLLYKIQLTNYESCVRTKTNQESVKAYNQRLLDFASEAGVDATILYVQLENLFVPQADCVYPTQTTIPSNGG